MRYPTSLRQLVDLARLVALTVRTPKLAPVSVWVPIYDAWLEWVPGSGVLLEDRARAIMAWVEVVAPVHRPSRVGWVAANEAYRVRCIRAKRLPQSVVPGHPNPVFVDSIHVSEV